MDRTHMSMSVANTSFQDPFGDISFASDGTGTLGTFSEGFNVDSGMKPSQGHGRLQTPYARRGRFGYADEEDEDERSADISGATPLWGREGLSTLSSGGKSGDVSLGRGRGFAPSSGGRDRDGAFAFRDSQQLNSGQSNRMMLDPSGSAGNHFNSMGGAAFDQLVRRGLNKWELISLNTHRIQSGLTYSAHTTIRSLHSKEDSISQNGSAPFVSRSWWLLDSVPLSYLVFPSLPFSSLRPLTGRILAFVDSGGWCAPGAFFPFLHKQQCEQGAHAYATIWWHSRAQCVRWKLDVYKVRSTTSCPILIWLTDEVSSFSLLHYAFSMHLSLIFCLKCTS